MCFSKYGIGCCQFNIRHIADDGEILWRKRRDCPTLAVNVQPGLNGASSILPALCAAHLADGSVIVGGAPRRSDRALLDCYSAGGSLVWSLGFDSLLTQPTGDFPDESDVAHLEWWVNSVDVTPDDTIVFVAHRQTGVTPDRCEHRIIECDADGTVVASTSITAGGIARLRCSPDGDVIASRRSLSSGGAGNVRIWSADRSTYGVLSGYTLSAPIADAFARPSDGEIAIAANGPTDAFYTGRQQAGLWSASGGGQVWTLNTQSVSLATTGVRSIGQQSTGKMIIAGSLNLGGGLKYVARLTSGGVYEADLSPSGGPTEILGAARVATLPTDYLIYFGGDGVSQRDATGAKVWTHLIPTIWAVECASDGKLTVVGGTSRSSDEELFV